MSGPVDDEQKAIAERLSLRAPGPAVTRVSRKALLVLGGTAAVALGSALIWSTRAPPRKAPPPPPAATPRPPEKISSLPKDYLHRDTPPALGPPLPGDLGRPMLSASRAAARPEADPISALPVVAPPPVVASPAAQARLAGRVSGLFLTVSQADHGAVAELRSDASPTAGADPRTTSPERLQAPASPYLLQAGAIIPAALITGLRSDAPGVAIAQVTQDVHDSLGGGHLLIPAGAKLIGEYATTTIAGQSRLGVAWTRLILPSGASIILDKLPAADSQGMAGLEDGVDRHWGQVFAAAGLSTVLAIGAETGADGDSELIRALRRGSSQAVSDVGQQAVGRSLALAPTLTIRPGAPLRVLLTRDLVLEPYAGGRQ
ncbi:TrbI/VirB10 family protein [Caulobacter sp. UNC279MFTsu5.1]|uniref:TrbI/VirB10 family protein n=1 Tax=Caulobacter sp. UNC279MFTsu5.1 TaxID=1502775 RepID=UPI0008E2D536|nr:TrbI/VirB10 family protein [Caulobacter sp. UNC279MFTsu5.1]SFI53488.1 type IV secretion system protein VirB10 [Caulobacter sp. UNC279MFTsu5.1]